MDSATLQDDPSVDSFFNVVETETLVLFEHLSFEFLKSSTCSPRRRRGEHETTSHQR
ncbi:hypothetical protein SAMN06265347_1232 [Halobellus salinus]|nr:hypothetical protein SAMN06265347_1232 [Halobellus salinus]